MLVDFLNSFNVRISKKWLITRMKTFPPWLNFVATLPCKTNISVTVQGRTCTSCAWNCGGSASKNTRLHFSRFVASKQSRSQSSWLRDLGCHAASCIPEENPHHRRTEAEADWNLVRQLNSRLSTWLLINGTKDLIGACVRAKGGHFEHSLWIYWLSWFCQLFVTFVVMFCLNFATLSKTALL